MTACTVQAVLTDGPSDAMMASKGLLDHSMIDNNQVVAKLAVTCAHSVLGGTVRESAICRWTESTACWAQRWLAATLRGRVDHTCWSYPCQTATASVAVTVTVTWFRT